MPNYIVELEDGRELEVEADAPPTSEDLVQYFAAQNAPQAQPPKKDLPFGDITDVASALGQAASSTLTTVPASFRQMYEGSMNPWEKSAESLQSRKDMQLVAQEAEAAQAEAEASGDASVMGRSVRSAIPSLGFTGAILPVSVAAGGVAGLGTGLVSKNPVAAQRAAMAAGTAASGVAAYRMAASQFMDDARERIDNFFLEKAGRLPNKQEQEEAYQELLPLAQEMGMAEALPEAFGNLALAGAGKYIYRILGGKTGVQQLASGALSKVKGLNAAKALGAGAASTGVEVGTEGLTEMLNEDTMKKFEEGVMRGEEPSSVQTEPYSMKRFGEAVEKVAEPTLATTALLGGLGTVGGMAYRSATKRTLPESDFRQRMQTQLDASQAGLANPETTEADKSIYGQKAEEAAAALKALDEGRQSDVERFFNVRFRPTDPGIKIAKKLANDVANVDGARENAKLTEIIIDETESLADDAAAAIEGMSPPPVKSAVQPVEEVEEAPVEVTPSLEELVSAGIPEEEAQFMVDAWATDTEKGTLPPIEKIVQNFNNLQSAYNDASTIQVSQGESLADRIERLELDGVTKKDAAKQISSETGLDFDAVEEMINSVRRFRRIPQKPGGNIAGITIGDRAAWDAWREKRSKELQSQTQDELVQSAIGVVHDLQSQEAGSAMDLDEIEMALDNVDRAESKGKTIDWSRETSLSPNISTASLPDLKKLLPTKEGRDAIRAEIARKRLSEKSSPPTTQQENAPDQIPDKESVRQEPQGGTESRTPEKTGVGDQLFGAAPSEEEVAVAREALSRRMTGQETASWVIRNKDTKEVVMETFDKKKVDALNTKKYEAVPIAAYLAELNQPITQLREEPTPATGMLTPGSVGANLMKPYAAISIPDLEALSESDWSKRRAYLQGKIQNAQRDKDILNKIPKNQWGDYEYNENAKINDVFSSVRAAIQDMQFARPDLEKNFTSDQGKTDGEKVQRTTSKARATSSDLGGKGNELQQQPEALSGVSEQPEFTETSGQPESDSSLKFGSDVVESNAKKFASKIRAQFQADELADKSEKLKERYYSINASKGKKEADAKDKVFMQWKQAEAKAIKAKADAFAELRKQNKGFTNAQLEDREPFMATKTLEQHGLVEKAVGMGYVRKGDLYVYNPGATGKPVQAAPSAAQAAKATAPGPVSPILDKDVRELAKNTYLSLEGTEAGRKLTESAEGVFIGHPSGVDELYDSKRIEAGGFLIKELKQAADDLYSAYAPVRSMLRRKFGPKITLYRSQGSGEEGRVIYGKKSTLNWASTPQEASQYDFGGRTLIKKEIPVEDIVAVNVGPKGNYDEFVVFNEEAKPDLPPSAIQEKKNLAADFQVKRGANFSSDGVYDVSTPDGVRHIFRDPETGAWMDADEKSPIYSPLPFKFLGYSKKEALESLRKEYQTTPVATPTETAVPSAKGTAVASVGSNLAGGRSSELPASKTPESQPSTKESSNPLFQYAKGVMSLFPKLANVEVVMVDDAKGQELNKQQKSTQFTNRNWGGSSAIDPNTGKRLLLIPIWSNASRVAHEIGHAIEKIYFAEADQKTKDEIIKAHDKWAKKWMKRWRESSLTQADKSRLWEDWANEFPESKDPSINVARWNQSREYLTSFPEWFADNFSKWSSTNKKPVGLLEKFFNEVFEQLQKLWSIVRKDFAPDTTVKNFIEGIADYSAVTVPTAESKEQIKKDAATVEQIARLVSSGAKPEEMDKFVKSLTDDQFNELIDKGMYDASPNLRIEPQDSNQEKSRKKRKFVKQVVDVMAVKASRKSIIDSVIDKDKTNIKYGKVTRANAEAARNLLNNSGQIPNAFLTRIYATPEEFLNDRNNQRLYPSAYARMMAEPNVEGLYADKTTFVFASNIGVSNLDRNIGTELGISAEQAAARRVILHENGHRGVDLFDPSELREFRSFVNRTYTAEEIDNLVRLYTEYADWRTNPRSRDEALEEIFQKKFERLTKIPTGGIWDEIVEFLKRVWRRMTGRSGDPTLKDMKDVVRLLRNAMKRERAPTRDYTLKNGGGVRLSLSDENKFENKPSLVINPRASSSYSGRGVASIPPSDNSARAQAIREGVSRANWDELSTTQRAKALEEFGLKSISSRYSFDAAILPVRLTNERTDENRPVSVYAAEPSPAIAIQFDASRLSNLLSGDAVTAFAAIYDIAQEEVIHTAQHLNAYAKWQDSGVMLPFEEFEVNYYTSMLLEMVQAAGAGLSGGDARVANIIVSAWNLYNPNVPSNDVNQIIGNLVQTKTAPAFTMEIGRQLLQFKRQDFTTETGWMRFVEAMKGYLADAVEALKTSLSLVRSGQAGEMIRREIQDVESILNRLETNPDSILPDAKPSRVEYASDYSEATSAGAQLARDTIYDDRIIEMRDAIRRAYEQSSTEAGVAIPLDELYAKAKELVPEMTENEFGNILQDLYEDNGAVLQEGESAFDVFTPEGRRAGFAVIMPKRAVASRVETEGEAVDEYKNKIEAINSNSLNAFFGGRQVKGASPQVRTVKPSKSYEQAAIELVNDLTKDRTPIEDIAESLFSDEFLQGLGIKLDIPALVSLIAEVKNRVSNQSRDDKIPGARRIKLQKLDRKLAGYWQDLGTNSGRSQGIRSYITRNPRYSWMFIFDRANENLEKEGKLAATRVASDLPQTAENLQKTDAKVGEDAGEQAADDLEDDQDDIDLAEGEATLDQKGKTLWEKFKDLIRKRGIAMRALNALRAGNKAKASISSEERNAISQMSEEELVKFIAGIDKEMADVFDEFTKAPATRKKREKMVATAKKRAEQGKPIEPKQSAAKEKLSGAERTAQNILKDLSERYADPNIYTDAKRAKINEMRELYKKRVKQGVGPEQMSEQDFVSKAVSLGANKLTAETLWKAAELEIEAREAMRQEEVLGKITLEKLQREISALRPGEKAPFSKQIPWRKLLSQKASTVETYRQRVFDTISSEESLSDLDEAQKAKLADLLTQAWESKRKAILDRMVDNAISQEQAAGRLTKEGADALRSQRQKLVEDINLGILDEDRLMKHLADKFGIKSEFTEAERVNIDRLLDILQDDKLNEVKRNKAGYELLEALSSVTKIPIAKLLADYWVSSVLSGVNTAASIAMAVMSGGYELTSGAFRILRAGFTNPKELPAEIAASFKAMAEFLKAFGREGRLAWQYLVTGDRAFLDPSMNTVLNDLNYDSIGKTVSLAEKMAKSDKIMQRVMGIWMRSVSRLLTALDSFNSGVTKAGALPIVFRQLNLDAESLKQATEKYNLKLYREKAIQEDFDNKQPTNQHEKALVDSYAKARMMADLQEFGKFSENADFFGQQGAMTLDPTGIGGFIYSSIKSLTGGATDRADKFLAEAEREWKQADGGDKTAKGLQLAFAYFLQFGAYNSANLAGLRFARFAGNKFNQGLSFIPGIGMLRMYESTAKDSKIEAKDAFTDMIMRNQLAGLLLSLAGFAVIQAIMDEPDDEKRGWFINGGWANLTPDRKQQKLAAGQKEFTIGIGGKVYNYQNWPISPILAAIGSLSDLIRYSRDQWNEKSIADRLVSAAASGVFSAGEIPALSGFQTLFGNNLSSKDPNEKRLDRFAKVMAGWGGGFVPRILKDVDFMTDPGLRKYESLWEQTASHIPVYRRYSGEEYYDILGKQIERKVWPGSREFMELETDPEYRTLGKLNSRGIWLTPANAEHRMVGKGRFKRKLTQEEADAYSLETGKGYRQMLLRYGSRLEQMPTERARAFLMDKADEVRDRALQKITR